VRSIVPFAALLALVASSHLRPDTGRLPVPCGLLETNTLFTVYGRGFGICPILGRLGTYKDCDMMAADTAPWVAKIQAANSGKGVVTGIHLIYGLAVPCTGGGSCLKYLDEDLVEKYILPAQERGWAVVLDTQLGSSDPVAQVNRMIEHGYLKYDNVHVAIDPEFHVVSGERVPGIPIGTVEASQINEVQEILDRYVETEGLRTKKILIVHQFGDRAVHDGVPFMIQHKEDLREFENVELVIDADGLGTPATKIRKYNLMTDARVYPFVRFRGIKVFYPNQWEQRGHFDKPPMTIDQVFGIEPIPGGLRMADHPNVLIIA
jgi:hypothetical protein